MAKTAASFINTEGVNIGGLGAYYLQGQLTDLAYLGIDNVRAGWATPGSNGYDTVAQAASLAAAGIKFDFLADSDGNLDPANEIATFASLDAIAPSSVAYVEGLNEINNQPISYGGYTNDNGQDEFNAATAYQKAIYQATTAALPGAGVIYFTGYDAGDVPTGGDPLAGGLATMDNEHFYATGAPDTVTPAQAFPNLTASELASAQANGQLAYTEAGYNSDTVGLTAQAQYTLDMLFDDANNGIAITDIYDLADSDFDGYGLFTAFDSSNPNAPKPVAMAIHDLNSLLTLYDTGTVTDPTPVTYTVSGETNMSHDMELTQTDGGSVIMLWNEGSTSIPELVTLGTKSDVSVYDPINNNTLVAGLINTGSIWLTVGADPLILEVTPQVTPTNPAPIVCGSGPDEIKIFVSGIKNSSSFYIGVGTGNPASGGTVTPELITSANLNDGTQQEVDIYGTFNPATAYHFGIAGMAGETMDVDSVIYQGVTSTLNAQFVDTGDSNNDGFGFEAYGTVSDAPVSVGSGPDSVTLYLQGNEGDIHYEVGVNSEAWSDYQQTGATSADGETQEITLYGTFKNPDYLTVVLDDGQSSSSVPTGGGIAVDPNQTLTVKSIVYNGTSITEGATITASEYGQSFVFQSPVVTPPSSPTITMTQFAAPATSGLLATPLITYNWNPQTQLASFLSDVSKGTATIEFMGDSTTTGVGGDPNNLEDYAGGYPEETAYWLNQDGVAAQDANFLGNNNSGGDSQISFTNGGSYSSAEAIAGEEPVLPNQGATMTFDPTNPIYGNQIETQLFGNYSGNKVQVTVNGSIVAGTLTVSSSGAWDNDVLTLSQATTIDSVTYTELTPTSSAVYIEGTETSNNNSPAIQVLNSGISGGTAQADNYQENPGDFGNSSGEVPTTIQINPSLVLLNYGINDLLYYGTTVSQLIGFIGSTVKDLQAAGEDVILVSPTPFNGGPVTTTTESQFVAALQTLAVADHIGLIDLNDTYGQDLTALQAAGGISSNPGGVHPDATLYANIGKGIASLLANAIK